MSAQGARLPQALVDEAAREILKAQGRANLLSAPALPHTQVWRDAQCAAHIALTQEDL